MGCRNTYQSVYQTKIYLIMFSRATGTRACTVVASRRWTANSQSWSAVRVSHEEKATCSGRTRNCYQPGSGGNKDFSPPGTSFHRRKETKERAKMEKHPPAQKSQHQQLWRVLHVTIRRIAVTRMKNLKLPMIIA
jgi:hypothetical protein